MNLPYTVELVPSDRNWILEKIAREIQKAAACVPGNNRYSVRDVPSDTADLVFFLPDSAYRPLNHSMTVTYLAHREEVPEAADIFNTAARSSDACVTSSSKYQALIEEVGAKQVFKIPLGVDTELFTPRLRIGVVGRTYHTGRKGEALLSEIAGHPLVELRFTGSGWPFPAQHYSTEDLVEFYRDLDYLLVPSLIEGGPVPMLEALAAGCPVVAPTDIGMVADFPHIPFKRGDAADLRRTVEGLLQQKLALREKVLDCDWKLFGRRHVDLFTRLIDERRAQKITASAAVPGQGGEERLQVMLLTHGTEDAALGGPSTRVRFLVENLTAQGHKVVHRHNVEVQSEFDDFDVVHIFNTWPPHTAIKSMALARAAGKTVIFSPIALDLADWPIYRQLLELAFSQGDQETLQSVIAQLSSITKPRLYDGSDPSPPIEGIPSHFEALRACCALADRLIFLSDLERRFLAAIGARTDHGVIIANGVSNSFHGHDNGERFLREFGFTSYILCVGRVEYRKNQALLTLAMRGVPASLIIIGDPGDAGYLEHTLALSGGNVYHYGRISDKELLASAYAGAAGFVLPSWCEGAPLVALEAGMAGTPLLLSSMSSEREYFGEQAEYVSPVDIEGMRAAILRMIQQPQSPEQRAARAEFVFSRYSETRHVEETCALYRKALPHKAERHDTELVVEASALLHSLRVSQHLTGVPLVERHVIREIVAMRPDARLIVYNNLKDRFIEVPYAELEDFNEGEFNQRHWFSQEESDAFDLRRVLTLRPMTPVPDIVGKQSEVVNEEQVLSRRARLAQRLLRWGIPIDTIRRMSVVSRALQSIPGKAAEAIEMVSSDRTVTAEPVRVSAGDLPLPQNDLSDLTNCFAIEAVARPKLSLRPGSRILTIGQSWISNEPLLDSLLKFSAGHRLEAYVYDLSYITGAHLSGWDDNRDRERKLVKLLSHVSRVYTESKQAAGEIAKFMASRRMSAPVVTTQLRGKDPSAKRRRPPIDAPYIVYVSSFNRRKNHDFILQVWRELYLSKSALAARGTRLILIGEVQGEAKFGDPAFLAELGVFNVSVVNNVDDDLLSDYYRHSLFTIYPSLQEGWGIPVQESLTHGRICLVSKNVPAAKEIDNAALIKLDPHDFFAWVEAFSSWADNAAMRVAFEKQALQYVQPTWKQVAERILKRA